MDSEASCSTSTEINELEPNQNDPDLTDDTLNTFFVIKISLNYS